MGTVVDLGAKREEKAATPDQDILDLCEALREYVDHANQAPAMIQRNGVYVPNPVKQGAIQSVEHDGIEVGYRILEHEDGITCTREVFVRFPQPIGTIPDEQKDPVMLAIFDAFLMEGQGEVDMLTFKFGDVRVKNTGTHDCIRIRQDFAPLVLQGSGGSGIKIDDNLERLLGRE